VRGGKKTQRGDHSISEDADCRVELGVTDSTGKKARELYLFPSEKNGGRPAKSQLCPLNLGMGRENNEGVFYSGPHGRTSG